MPSCFSAPSLVRMTKRKRHHNPQHNTHHHEEGIPTFIIGQDVIEAIGAKVSRDTTTHEIFIALHNGVFGPPGARPNDTEIGVGAFLLMLAIQDGFMDSVILNRLLTTAADTGIEPPECFAWLVKRRPEELEHIFVDH